MKEGTVVLWAPHALVAEKYLAKFKQRYPSLKLELWYSGDMEIAEKFLLETKSGQNNVDLLGLTEQVIVSLPKDLLAKYDWPNAAKWPAFAYPKDRLWLRYYLSTKAPVINTKLVSAAEAPKSWEDLKDPKWKGKAAASLTSEEAPLAMAAMLAKGGELAWEKSFAFWTEVVKTSQPRIVNLSTGPTTLLGTGEFQILLYGSGSVAARQATEGQPVGFPSVGLVPASASVLAIPKQAPHPNSARLLADFMTTIAGNKDFVDAQFTTPVNPDVPSVGARLHKEKGDEFFLYDDFLTAENMKKSSDFWRQLLKK
ncbi:MAG: extracellular solute-binding protein [Chloroflexi bacterium]|nr:extracellular solute-binding protein [Chloroflexota bacterium]